MITLPSTKNADWTVVFYYKFISFNIFILQIPYETNLLFLCRKLLQWTQTRLLYLCITGFWSFIYATFLVLYLSTDCFFFLIVYIASRFSYKRHTLIWSKSKYECNIDYLYGINLIKFWFLINDIAMSPFVDVFTLCSFVDIICLN